MADNITTDAVEYTQYEELNLPEVETIQNNFEYWKSIEKLDAQLHVRNLPDIPEPVDPKMEYAICPTTATCVESNTSHIIPLDFWNSQTNDSNMLATANRITITKTGTYMVTWSIVYSNDTTWDWRWVTLSKNGSSIGVDEINPDTWWNYTNATCMTRCSAWDYVELIWLVNANSCVDTRTWDYQTFLHVAKLSG